MKAYSLDLRQKIIETYETEKISQRKLAARFRVALSFISKLLNQWREKRDLRPKSHGGGKKLKLLPAHIIILGDLVQEKNDATQKELSEQLHEKTGVKVSGSTVSRVLTRLNLTVKKKR
ncbi:MAG: helix-turn-helix domain-containing protein [Microcystaceae cyanobacterium]